MSSFSDDYYRNTRELKPSPLLVTALKHIKSLDKTALDLGCGAGRDTRLLLGHGFKVTAVDNEPLVEQYLERLYESGDLTFVLSTFANFDYKKYDLINARYSLPFNPPENFSEVINDILTSLNPGGVFVGQFFGINDEWNIPGSTMTFHTKTELLESLSSLEIIRLNEKDENGTLANGASKHWHVFNVIARKKPLF